MGLSVPIGSVGADAALPPVEARFRKPFSVSGVLDDTIAVFRQAWLSFILLDLLAGALGVAVLLLAGAAFLVSGGLALVGMFSTLTRPGAVPTGAQLAALFAAGGLALVILVVLGLLVGLSWYAAIALMTDRIVRGQRLGVWAAMMAGLRRAPALLVSTILVILGMGLAIGASMAIGAVLIYALRWWSLLVLLADLVALLVWAARPAARVPWLKWAIVILTPFGLPMYFGVCWSLYVPAGSVERDGPAAALSRSAALVARTWFRVLAALAVIGIVVSLLQGIPGVIIGTIAGGISLGVGRGGSVEDGISALQIAANVAQVAGNYVGGVLFGAISTCAQTLVFLSLRNDREGTDLAERLTQLDVTDAPPPVPMI